MTDEELNFLPYFIDEEIYLISESQQATNSPLMNPKGIEVEESEVVPLEIIGDHQQQILVLINDPQFDLDVNDPRNLLIKILAAVNIGLKEVAIVDTAQASGEQVNAVLTTVKPRTILIFGNHRDLVPFDVLEQYQITIRDPYTLLYADAPSHLAQDPRLKKNLWDSLKLLFKIG